MGDTSPPSQLHSCCLLGALAAHTKPAHTRHVEGMLTHHATPLRTLPSQRGPSQQTPYCRRCLVRLPPASCWSTPASSNASGSSTLCEDASPAGAAGSFAGSCTPRTQTVHRVHMLCCFTRRGEAKQDGCRAYMVTQ